MQSQLLLEHWYGSWPCQGDLELVAWENQGPVDPVLMRLRSKGSKGQTPLRSRAQVSALPIQCLCLGSFGGYHGLQGRDLGAASGLHRAHFHVVERTALSAPDLPLLLGIEP